MSIRTPLRSWLLTLICVSLLMVRVGGTHLHLCFDGSEPPASFHLLDDGEHHEAPGASAPHLDTDVALGGELLSKAQKSGFDLPLLLLVAAFLWALAQRPIRFAPRLSQFPVYSQPAFLRPPLRGPPSNSYA